MCNDINLFKKNAPPKFGTRSRIFPRCPAREQSVRREYRPMPPLAHNDATQYFVF